MRKCRHQAAASSDSLSGPAAAARQSVQQPLHVEIREIAFSCSASCVDLQNVSSPAQQHIHHRVSTLIVFIANGELHQKWRVFDRVVSRNCIGFISPVPLKTLYVRLAFLTLQLFQYARLLPSARNRPLYPNRYGGTAAVARRRHDHSSPARGNVRQTARKAA